MCSIWAMKKHYQHTIPTRPELAMIDPVNLPSDVGNVKSNSRGVLVPLLAKTMS